MFIRYIARFLTVYKPIIKSLSTVLAYRADILIFIIWGDHIELWCALNLNFDLETHDFLEVPNNFYVAVEFGEIYRKHVQI
jgi:hypothetical protein